MEVRNINTHAEWFASYEDSAQGRALIRCQAKKIKQLSELIENIKGEIELTGEPREYNDATILASIETLINQEGEVEHAEGYFKWEG